MTNETQQYDNSNRGVLFKQYPAKKSNQPNWKGELDIEGAKHVLAGWVRKTKEEKAYLSLALEGAALGSDLESAKNGGALFSQEKKSEKSPDYSGPLEVGGAEYRLAGWAKTSKKGARYISLKVEKALVSSGDGTNGTDKANGANGGEEGDDIPF